MTSPEQTDYYSADEQAPEYAAGALALVPAVQLIEHLPLEGYEAPLALVTKRSFLALQNANDKGDQLLAHYTWAKLNKCMPGTFEAEQWRDLYLDNSGPNLYAFGVIDPRKHALLGLHAYTFSYLVQGIVDYHPTTPSYSEAAVSFLNDLTERVEAELKASQ